MTAPFDPFGERHDAAYRLALRGRPDPFDEQALPAFERCAKGVFDPLLACVEDE